MSTNNEALAGLTDKLESELYIGQKSSDLTVKTNFDYSFVSPKFFEESNCDCFSIEFNIGLKNDYTFLESIPCHKRITLAFNGCNETNFGLLEIEKVLASNYHPSDLLQVSCCRERETISIDE